MTLRDTMKNQLVDFVKSANDLQLMDMLHLALQLGEEKAKAVPEIAKILDKNPNKPAAPPPTTKGSRRKKKRKLSKEHREAIAAGRRRYVETQQLKKKSPKK